MANILDAARAAVAPAALDHEAALAALSSRRPTVRRASRPFAERRAPAFHQESS